MPTRVFGFEARALPEELWSEDCSMGRNYRSPNYAAPACDQPPACRSSAGGRASRARRPKSRYAPCSMTKETTQKPRRAIVAAVQRPSVSDAELEASLTELRQLAKTLGFDVIHTFTQKRAGFDSAGYFGEGKRK